MTFSVELQRLRNGDDIAQMVGCPPAIFNAVVGGDESFFVTHEIPKRNRARGVRKVVAVSNDALLDAYRHLSDRFRDALKRRLGVFPHPAAHGYVDKRSILTNAQAHMPCEHMLKADIANFFNSITSDRVERMLVEFDMQPEAARTLARFTTFRGELPLGFPSSPTLANAVCLKLDEQLTNVAIAHGCTYTRYADDLTFSNKVERLPKRVDVEGALIKEGFRLAEDKFFQKKRGNSFYITGLSVSEERHPRAPRSLKKRLRQELHFARTLGARAHIGARGYTSYESGVNQITGSIRFLHSIEPALAANLRSIWEEALAKDGMSAVQQARPGKAPTVAAMLFDESVLTDEATGKRTMVLGAVLTEDLDAIRPLLVQLAQGELADVYGTSKKGPLARDGLHWKELNHPTRDAFAKLLAALPVRCYLAFAELTDAADYKNMYLELLSRLIARRLIALDGRVLHLIFENNQQVRLKDVKETVDALYQEQTVKNGRRPLRLLTHEATKQSEPCVALADGLLGLLGDFATDETETSMKRYERVRGKYRIIESLDEGIVYTRRRPLPRMHLAAPSVKK